MADTGDRAPARPHQARAARRARDGGAPVRRLRRGAAAAIAGLRRRRRARGPAARPGRDAAARRGGRGGGAAGAPRRVRLRRPRIGGGCQPWPRRAAHCRPGRRRPAERVLPARPRRRRIPAGRLHPHGVRQGRNRAVAQGRAGVFASRWRAPSPPMCGRCSTRPSPASPDRKLSAPAGSPTAPSARRGRAGRSRTRWPGCGARGSPSTTRPALSTRHVDHREAHRHGGIFAAGFGPGFGQVALLQPHAGHLVAHAAAGLLGQLLGEIAGHFGRGDGAQRAQVVVRPGRLHRLQQLLERLEVGRQDGHRLQAGPAAAPPPAAPACRRGRRHGPAGSARRRPAPSRGRTGGTGTARAAPAGRSAAGSRGSCRSPTCR